MKRSLQEIQDALKEARYDRAFKLCSRALNDSRKNDSEFLYFGACALFGLGHIHQAEDWVTRHAKATGKNAANLYLDAYVELHSRRFQKALLNWTRILEIDPSQTLADKLIDKLRRGENSVFREIMEPHAFINYVPLDRISFEKPGYGGSKEKRGIPKSIIFNKPGIIYTGAALLIAGIIIALILFFMKGMSIPSRDDLFRIKTETLPAVPESGSVTPREQFQRGEEMPVVFYRNLAEALQEYRNAREKIGRGDVNQGRFLLGRIELSNASFAIKERALLLRDSIPYIRRENFRDPIGVKEILENPYMLRGAVILWGGMIKSVTESSGALLIKMESDESPHPLIVVAFIRDKIDRDKNRELTSGKRIQIFGIFSGKRSDDSILVKGKEIWIKPGNSQSGQDF